MMSNYKVQLLEQKEDGNQNATQVFSLLSSGIL
jgi:hypothetical protein